MIYEIKNEHLTVKINSLGAELISAVGSDGFEYMWAGNAWSGRAPVLFPLCGRVKDFKYTYLGKEYEIKQHGFARNSEFELLEKTDSSVSLRLSPSDSTRATYPFEFELVARYSLYGKELRASYTVTNTENTVMPYMFGWHPAFALEGDCPISDFVLDFGDIDSLSRRPLTDLTLFEHYTLPFPLDNGKYTLNTRDIEQMRTIALEGTRGYARLYSKTNPHSVTLTYGENIPYFCIWKLPESEARYLCLEPWNSVSFDTDSPENFETRNMPRLSPLSSEDFNYTVIFE